MPAFTASWFVEGERRSIDQNFAALERKHLEERQGEFGPTRSQEPDQAQDLALAKTKGHVLEFALARSALDL